MPSRKSRAKPPGRAISKGQRRVHSEMAVGTTVSGPSHQTESLTELADHDAPYAVDFAELKGTDSASGGPKFSIAAQTMLVTADEVIE